MVEGIQTSMDGDEINYDAAFLGVIAEATNTWNAEGNCTKLFTDHEYEQENVIGLAPGPFVARVITEDDLPHEGMADLIGKVAIFCESLNITEDSAVQAYKDGRLKSVSIGLDLTGEIASPNVIYEISAVPFPAVRGASIYSKPGAKGMARPAKYRLTLEAEMAHREKMGKGAEKMEAGDGADEAYSAYRAVLANIAATPEEQMKGKRDKLMQQAHADFGKKIMEIHGMMDPEKDPDDDGDDDSTEEGDTDNDRDMVMPKKKAGMNKEDYAADMDEFDMAGPADKTRGDKASQERARTKPGGGGGKVHSAATAQYAQLQAEIAELRAENEAVKRYQAKVERVTQYRAKAQRLMQQGKLTPIQFKKLFGEEASGVQQYSAITERKPDPVGFLLDFIETTGTNVVLFGSQLGDQPLESKDSQREREAEEKVQRYLKSRGHKYYGEAE
jgi:hypothetical protein